MVYEPFRQIYFEKRLIDFQEFMFSPTFSFFKTKVELAPKIRVGRLTGIKINKFRPKCLFKK